jgi:hypothetical protein
VARYRTIKPEFWTSEQVVECSTNARLLFIGMWNFCDDVGRHAASYARLKMEVFPNDPFTKEQIAGWVAELVAAGLVVHYESEGVAVWQVTGWHHQRIDKPGKSTLPPPPEKFQEHSENAPRTFPDRSAPEGSRVELSRVELRKEPASAGSPPSRKLANGSGERFAVAGEKTWELPEEKLAEYREAFPGLDLAAEFRKARLWLDEHRERKPRSGTGVQRFVTRWLGRAYDDLRKRPGATDRKPALIGRPGQ